MANNCEKVKFWRELWIQVLIMLLQLYIDTSSSRTLQIDATLWNGRNELPIGAKHFMESQPVSYFLKSAWLFSSALCHWGHFEFKQKTLEQESFKREIQNYFFSIVHSFYINSTRLKNFTDTRIFFSWIPINNKTPAKTHQFSKKW